MLLRTLLGVIGVIETLAPRRVGRFWVDRCCHNPEDVELRPWVVTAIRLEGVLLLGWVLWRSRDSLENMAGGEYLSEVEDTVADTDLELDEESSEEDSPDQIAAISPNTRRFDLSRALYHAEDPLTVADIVSRSAETDWSVGRSPASATLYRMYNDDVVDRTEGEEGSFEYWLTEAGRAALEASEGNYQDDPFGPTQAESA